MSVVGRGRLILLCGRGFCLLRNCFNVMKNVRFFSEFGLGIF